MGWGGGGGGRANRRGEEMGRGSGSERGWPVRGGGPYRREKAAAA
jgi:hypothetical protein